MYFDFAVLMKNWNFTHYIEYKVTQIKFCSSNSENMHFGTHVGKAKMFLRHLRYYLIFNCLFTKDTQIHIFSYK